MPLVTWVLHLRGNLSQEGRSGGLRKSLRGPLPFLSSHSSEGEGGITHCPFKKQSVAFQMFIPTQLPTCIWFVMINVKDKYFHISIFPQHRKYLRFSFRGKAYQSGSSFWPCTIPSHYREAVLAHIKWLRLRLNS